MTDESPNVNNMPLPIDTKVEAREKASRLTRKAITMISISILAGAGIVGLTNSLFKDAPKVSEVSMAADGRVFSYNFTVENKQPKKYKVVFTVTLNNDKILDIDATESTKYTGAYTCQVDGTLTWDLTYTNRVDYRKTLQKGTLSIQGGQ